MRGRGATEGRVQGSGTCGEVKYAPGEKTVTLATNRAESAARSAVLVHPEDERGVSVVVSMRGSSRTASGDCSDARQGHAWNRQHCLEIGEGGGVGGKGLVAGDEGGGCLNEGGESCREDEEVATKALAGRERTKNCTACSGCGGSVLLPVAEGTQSGPCSLLHGVAGDGLVSWTSGGEDVRRADLNVDGTVGGVDVEGKGGGTTVKGAEGGADAAAEGALCEGEL